MAIYKSSFNKKSEKKEKPPKERAEKPKVKKFNKKANTNVVCLIVCSLIFLVCLLPSNFLKNFILGVVGLSIYPLTLIGILFSTLFLLKKKYNLKQKYLVLLSTSLGIIWFIFHLILTSKISLSSYGIYLKETYLARTTAGGIIFSLISYPMVKLLTYVGSYIICAIALAIFVGLIVDYVTVQKNTGFAEKKTKFDFGNFNDFNFEEPKQPPISKEEQSKKIAKQKLGLEKSESTIISSSMPTYELNLQQEKPVSKRDYILTPLDPVIPPEKTASLFERKKNYNSNISKPTNQINNFNEEILKRDVEEIIPTEEPKIEEEYVEPISPNYEPIQSSQDIDEVVLDENEDLSNYETAFETEPNWENTEEALEDDNEYNDLEDLNEDFNDSTEETEVEEITPNLSEKDYFHEYAYTKDTSDLGSTVDPTIVRPSIDISKFNLPNKVSKTFDEPEEKVEQKPKQPIPPYVAPPVELLNYLENPVRISDEELQDNIDRLEQVLEDFKVPAKVNNVQVGPAVTRYELTMPRGISVNKIAQMADDIAMTLASNGSIRVEAPIPGKNSVGIEVPNAQVSPVSLRELIDSNEFRNRANPLSFVLGKDINGDIIFCNLDKMPHVLVAGSTGSGKSVCLNTMLLSMCYKAGPQDLRLILIDPKMVEFSTYNGLPHLLIPEVITSKEMTINALDWAIKEMERRYAMFAKNRVVNIVEFNKSEAVRSKREDKIPYIVIVVDELADLMLEAKREIDDRINKLAAKARAAGIHLVLATQRPSVDVITGTVKANLPSRIAFALTNFMDSKTILDGSGAEKLLGKGDMLFKPQDKPEPRRVQGAYVSNPEISAVVEYIKSNNNPVYDDDTGRAIKNPRQEPSQMADTSNSKEMEFDPVLKDALKWFIQVKQASGSMISRRFSVGFNRAGRIMDQMEQAGFIGPQEGSKPRQVLISMDEYTAIFGDE